MMLAELRRGAARVIADLAGIASIVMGGAALLLISILIMVLSNLNVFVSVSVLCFGLVCMAKGTALWVIVGVCLFFFGLMGISQVQV